MIVEVAPVFRPYLDEALIRFFYLHPDVDVSHNDGFVELHTDDRSVAAAFRHTLYRQKIYRETSALRQTLIESLAG